MSAVGVADRNVSAVGAAGRSVSAVEAADHNASEGEAMGRDENDAYDECGERYEKEAVEELL